MTYRRCPYCKEIIYIHGKKFSRLAEEQKKRAVRYVSEVRKE